MGLIALFGFLFCALVVTLISAMCALLATKIYKFRNPAINVFYFVVTMLVAAIVIWVAFNFQNLAKQREINSVMKDCGWKTFKKISEVEGIYIEPLPGNPAHSGSDYFLQLYPAVEYSNYGREIIRLTRNASGKVEEETLNQRTFRYGFRTTEELVKSNIVRTKKTILDFDSREVLAENVSYAFKDLTNPKMKDLLLAFVTFHPSGCGWMGGRQSDERYIAVLQPKGVFSREQYGSISNIAPQDVKLEILEEEVFKPEKVLTAESWSEVAFDRTRNAVCEQMVRRENERSPLLTFIGDTTGKKRAWSGAGFGVCESNAIWMGRYVNGSDRNNMLIEKYAVNGDLIYKIRFAKPDEPGGYHGSILAPTFRTENNYLYFEWWNTNQSGSGRHVARRMKVRVKEP